MIDVRPYCAAIFSALPRRSAVVEVVLDAASSSCCPLLVNMHLSKIIHALSVEQLLFAHAHNHNMSAASPRSDDDDDIKLSKNVGREVVDRSFRKS
jgi:hypothetical protein